MPRLVLPDTKFLPSFIEALKEGYACGIAKPMSEDKIKEIEADPFTYFELLNYQGGTYVFEDGIERKRVPSNHFWLVEGNKFIGGLNFRVELNDFLLKYAGHIGYGVRPSERGKGYAKVMTRMALEKMKKLHVHDVMITADDSNPASWKTIESCGGIFKETVPSIFDEGEIMRLYWIKNN